MILILQSFEKYNWNQITFTHRTNARNSDCKISESNAPIEFIVGFCMKDGQKFSLLLKPKNKIPSEQFNCKYEMIWCLANVSCKRMSKFYQSDRYIEAKFLILQEYLRSVKATSDWQKCTSYKYSYIIIQNTWTWICNDKTAVFFYLVAIFFVFSLVFLHCDECIGIMCVISSNLSRTVYISS